MFYIGGNIMRSPWLSREYEKSKDVVSEKFNNDSYLLVNKKTGAKIVLSNEEFDKYNSNQFNEIEWERLFLKGLATDKNCDTFEVSSDFDLENKEFVHSKKVTSFPIKVDKEKFEILINPDLGSWMAFTEEEFEKYKNNQLTQDEWLSLFIRGLADTKDNMEIDLDFPIPAEYPSVIVVNITTGCNLRCKYCFADCGPFKGENMTEDVMDATIDSMLSMPQIKVVTFEFQGGEASTNVAGMRTFIEKVEKVKYKYDKLVKYRTEINCISVTDELIKLVKDFNVSVGISLDGPKYMTDKTRVDINGVGAYDRIMKGIKKLRDNGIYIDGAVCTVGQHNVHYPKELMEFFDELGMNFKPRPVNILGREKENHLTTKPGEWAKCFKEMHKMKNDVDVENYSVHIFEENVYTPIRDYICLRYPCGAARELVSVNPNGDVFPCDGFKGEKKFVMGNVLNETIENMLKKPEIVKLRNRTAKTIKKCSTCMFRGMCCSCCYSAYGEFGDVYREDPQCVDRRQMYIYLIQSWIEENVLNKKKEKVNA